MSCLHCSVSQTITTFWYISSLIAAKTNLAFLPEVLFILANDCHVTPSLYSQNLELTKAFLKLIYSELIAARILFACTDLHCIIALFSYCYLSVQTLLE